MNKKSNRKGLLGIAVLAVISLVMCIGAHWEPRFPGDLRLTLLFQSVDGEPLTFVMEWVSRLFGMSQATVLVIVSAFVLWQWLGRLEAGLILTTGLSPLVYSILKLAVNRPRPSPDLVDVFVTEKGSGFPSGHAFFAVVFLGLLTYFVFTHVRKRGVRVPALFGLLTLILLIGASRVYLGAHWASDVLGGYMVGAVFLAVLVWLHREWKPQPNGSS